MGKLILFSMLVIAVSGCASAKKLNHLSIGMDRDQVFEKIGEPDATTAGNNFEMLHYSFVEFPFLLIKHWYVVLLEGGKVAKYGPQDAVFPPSEAELERRQREREIAMQINARQAEQDNEHQFQRQQDQQRQQQQATQAMQQSTWHAPAQTHCTSNRTGGTGTVYTDCSGVVSR